MTVMEFRKIYEAGKIERFWAKANAMKATICCYHHSSVSLFLFHIKMITAVYLQNDYSISLE